MLKTVVHNINYRMDIDSSTSVGSSKSSSYNPYWYQQPSYSCHEETVPDEAAISACYTRMNAQISGIKQTINQYQKEIDAYKKQIADINGKITEASQLQTKMSAATDIVNGAGLNISFEGCNTCVTNLVGTYNSMKGDCVAKIAELTTKQLKAKIDLAKAEAEKNKCANITKKVTVCN